LIFVCTRAPALEEFHMRFVPALGFLIAALSVAAQDGQKVKIEAPAVPGKAKVQTESLMHVTVVTESSAESRSSDIKLINRGTYRQENMEGGRVKLFCESATSMKNLEETKSPSTGKSFWVEGAAGQRKVTDEAGQPAEPHLAGWLDSLLLLPPTEVAVGDTWTADLVPIASGIKLDYDLGGLQLTCTLAELKDNQATISFKWDHKGSAKTKTLEMSLTGSLVMDLAKQRALKLQYQGTFALTEDLYEVGKNMNDGTGEQRKIGVLKIMCPRFSGETTIEYAE
jgi:hypothetical protein